MFVNRPTLEMGVNSAILQFNDGQFGIANVLSQFGIENGVYFSSLTTKANYSSVQNAISKVSDKVKTQRKRLKAIKKGLLDVEIEKEGGKSYVRGGN